MALSADNPAYNLLLEEKLNHANFIDWYRHLRIALRYEKKLYVLETPIPKKSPATAAKATRDAWIKHTDDSTQVSCLMLLTMIPDLQIIFEHVGAYEMLNQLKEMFGEQVRHEHIETIKAFIGCKMTEGANDSLHVLKMKNYINRLKNLGSPLSDEMATCLILNSLPKSYNEFVENFYNSNREMSILELQAALKTVKKNEKAKRCGVLNIREGRVMKLKPQAKAKVVISKSAKDDNCFHCGEVGHWLRNCPVYLEELKERRAREG